MSTRVKDRMDLNLDGLLSHFSKEHIPEFLKIKAESAKIKRELDITYGKDISKRIQGYEESWKLFFNCIDVDIKIMNSFFKYFKSLPDQIVDEEFITKTYQKYRDLEPGKRP